MIYKLKMRNWITGAEDIKTAKTKKELDKYFNLGIKNLNEDCELTISIVTTEEKFLGFKEQ